MPFTYVVEVQVSYQFQGFLAGSSKWHTLARPWLQTTAAEKQDARISFANQRTDRPKISFSKALNGVAKYIPSLPLQNVEINGLQSEAISAWNGTARRCVKYEARRMKGSRIIKSDEDKIKNILRFQSQTDKVQQIS